MPHFYLEEADFDEPTVYPFTKIEQHNFSKYTADSVYHYTETITPTNAIPSKVFSGFKKACHNLYKFDSKAEKDFAIILEDDKKDVLKWLRPAISQFAMYWKHNSQRYIPDFVVETADTIYMVEIKAEPAPVVVLIVQPGIRSVNADLEIPEVNRPGVSQEGPRGVRVGFHGRVEEHADRVSVKGVVHIVPVHGIRQEIISLGKPSYLELDPFNFLVPEDPLEPQVVQVSHWPP